jgi:hypothetical protein
MNTMLVNILNKEDMRRGNMISPSSCPLVLLVKAFSGLPVAAQATCIS